MSHRATNWAIEQRGLKPAAKIVLWHLADAHNPHHGCFPRQSTLATACEMSRSTLNLHLQTLEDRGLIRRLKSRCEQTNRQRVTRYWLAFEGDDEARSGDTPPPDDDPQDVVVSCPKTGHGNGADSVSENAAEPCPKNGQSRVRNSDSKKNPVKEPVNSTGNQREGAREDAGSEPDRHHPDLDQPSQGREAGDGGSTEPDPPETRPGTAAFEKRVTRFCTGKGYQAGPWPGWETGGALTHVAKMMAPLTEDQRQRAERFRDPYLWDVAQRGKEPSYPGNFLKHRIFEELDEALIQRFDARKTAEAVKAPPAIKPYGPVWAAMRMATIIGAVIPDLDRFRPTSFQRGLIDRGEATAETLAIERAVQRLDSEAEQRRSPPAPDWALALKDAMEPVPLDSALADAWRILFAARRWRFPPTPPGMRVVYLPKLPHPVPARTDEEDLDAAIDAFASAGRAAGAPAPQARPATPTDADLAAAEDVL